MPLKCLRIWSHGSTSLGLLIFSLEDGGEERIRLTRIDFFVNYFFLDFIKT